MADREYRTGFDWGRIRVILLAVIALLMLGFAIYKAGQVMDIFADRYTLTTLLPNAGGLTEGAPVTVAGQQVGQVKSIEFIPIERQRDDNHLVLKLEISEKTREQIRRDSQARLKFQSMVSGERYVDITPGTPGAAVLVEGDTLPGIPPTDLDDVLVRAAKMLDPLEQLLSNLRSLTGSLANGEGAIGKLVTDDDLYERVVVTTSELARTLHEINTSQGTFGRLLNDPALYDQLTATLARLDQVAGQLSDENGTLGKLVHSDSLYNALTGTVGRADSVLTSLDSVATAMVEGDGTMSKLLKDPALYDELLRTVVDLQNLLKSIREDPTQIRPNVKVDVF